VVARTVLHVKCEHLGTNSIKNTSP